MQKLKSSGAMTTDTPSDTGAPDTGSIAKTYAEIARRSSQLLADFMTRQAKGDASLFEDELGLTKAFYEMLAKLWSDPARVAEMQFRLWQDQLWLWQQSMLRLWGQGGAPL